MTCCNNEEEQLMKKPKGGKKVVGGALTDDLAKLAVPFAILLAKQGLDSMFAWKKKGKKSNKKQDSNTSTSQKPKAEKSKIKKADGKKKGVFKKGGCGCGVPPLFGGTMSATQDIASNKGVPMLQNNIHASLETTAGSVTAAGGKGMGPKKTPRFSSLAESIDNFLKSHHN